MLVVEAHVETPINVLDLLEGRRHERLPQPHVLRVAGVQLGGLLAANLQDLSGPRLFFFAILFLLDLVLILFRGGLGKVPDVDIDPSQLPHRVGRERLLVQEVLVAVQEHAELRAPVAEVVVGDDAVAQEAQQPGQGVADDGAAQVADVHRFRHIRRAVIDDISARRGRRLDAQALVARQGAQPPRQPVVAQSQVQEDAGDLRRLEPVAGVEAADDLAGHVRRLAAERLGELHDEVRLVVAVARVGRLDLRQVRSRVLDEAREGAAKRRLQALEEVHDSVRSPG